jgi:hypothetical protein
MNCKLCGSHFEPKTSWQSFCSRKHASKYKHDHEADGIIRICKGCGKEFNPKRISNKKGLYCSRQCRSENTKQREKARLLISALRRIHGCRICGNKSYRVICSRDCDLADGRNKSNASLRKYHPIRYAEKECIDCGNKFSVKFVIAHNKFNRCNKCKKRIARLKHNNGSHERRAKRAGVAYQYVIKEKVFERDGWRCHICKQKTPPKLMGTYNNRAPELDHIVPLSIGGPHVYENVKCCCRRCNGDKSCKPLGQPMLFGMIPTVSVVSKGLGGGG